MSDATTGLAASTTNATIGPAPPATNATTGLAPVERLIPRPPASTRTLRRARLEQVQCEAPLLLLTGFKVDRGVPTRSSKGVAVQRQTGPKDSTVTHLPLPLLRRRPARHGEAQRRREAGVHLFHSQIPHSAPALQHGSEATLRRVRITAQQTATPREVGSRRWRCRRHGRSRLSNRHQGNWSWQTHPPACRRWRSRACLRGCPWPLR